MAKKSSIDRVFHLNRGEKLLEEGRFEEAWELADQLLQKDSEDIQARYLMGRCALRLERPEEAVDHFALLTAAFPEDPVYLSGLGEALVSSGQSDKAIPVLFNALALDPQNVSAKAYLGIAFSQEGSYRISISLLEEVLETHPPFANNLHAHLARNYLRLGELEKALEHAQTALRLGTNYPADLEQITGYLIYAIRGDLEEARSHFMRALEIDPRSGDAFYHYASIKKFKEPEPQLVALAERNLKQTMPAFKRAYYHFGLGKIHDDLKEWETAFQHYRRANLIAKVPVDLSDLENLVEGFKKFFTPQLFEKYADWGHETEQPIFILGMPRSGSTLTEQILTSHPEVTTGGEIPAFPRISQQVCSERTSPELEVPECLKQGLDQALLGQIAEKYLEVLQQYGADKARIIDKLPGNLFFVGLIRLAFPKAHIIHTVRNPLDTCLSCYFQPFPESTWSFDFRWIGQYYRIAESMMDHWRKVLPAGSLLEVIYENLIEDTEIQARRIIDHCGLEWDDRCLDFHRAKRAVATASLWQVRQPVYKTSKHRWMHYAPYIGELVEALGPYAEPYYEALEARGCSFSKPLGYRLRRLLGKS